MRDDYLGALRERFGPDAATREPDPWEWTDPDAPDPQPYYGPCGAICLCSGGDPCVSAEYDPADDPRPIVTVEIPGVSR